jgi:branched-subunit amino acid transport protein
MSPAFDDATIWTVIIGMALGSFALRFVFIGLVGGRAMPLWLLRHLRYAAVAILPALVAPLVIWPPSHGGVFEPALGIGVALTVLVSALTRNVVFAMAAGAAGYIGASFLLG